MESPGPQHVGAPDPEHKTSPIIEDTDDEFDTIAPEVSEDGVCYFNDKTYAHGAYVCSGSELLHCERGLWVRSGGCDPDNP